MNGTTDHAAIKRVGWRAKQIFTWIGEEQERRGKEQARLNEERKAHRHLKGDIC